jgi:hypothetical protein
MHGKCTPVRFSKRLAAELPRPFNKLKERLEPSLAASHRKLAASYRQLGSLGSRTSQNKIPLASPKKWSRPRGLEVGRDEELLASEFADLFEDVLAVFQDLEF